MSLRVALAQVNATVGDLAGNAALVLECSQRAHDQGADLIAFPEMFLTGYPVEDLALRQSFIEASRQTLAALPHQLEEQGLARLTVIVGYLDQAPDREDRLGRPRHSPQNAAAVISGGSVVARYAKHHLPNYGVFDEFRYFVPGDQPCLVPVGDSTIAVAICEDLWQDGGPIAWAHQGRADLVVVINGSPYERNKDDVRLALCQQRASEADAPLAYVNMVGGQDELVFDGDSLVVDQDGAPLARAPQFESALLVVDLPATSPANIAPRLADEAEVYQALVTGLRDYVVKNHLPSVLLGLSGGIDSALTAAIAVDALGAEFVYGVALPSAYSSQHSQDDAADLAKRTGLRFRSISIAPMVNAFQLQLALTGLAEENLQARARGTTLMGLSNHEGHLVLATGNKSELAVGYSTLYGDAVGGYAPLKDVPKTLVWRLARWRNDEAERRSERPPIPPNSIDKPPSAELRPDQLDSDSLPPYELLDDVLDDYVEQDRGAADLVATGFDPDLVHRVLELTDHAEYKRRQYPPGPKISFKAFGLGPPAADYEPLARNNRRGGTVTKASTPQLPLAPTWVELASTPRALFLDIDGTLVEFESHPDLVLATESLIRLLRGASDALGGALALISGRSLADIDRIFTPWKPHAAGVHGAEVRGPTGLRTHHPEPSQLSQLRRACDAAAKQLTGVWVEDKGMSLALHYRKNPAAGDELGRLASHLADDSGGVFDVQPGVLVYELRPAAYDKGLAVAELMTEPPFVGRSPVVVGDDHTDEFAFAAALDMGGTAILVGDRSDTCAPLRLTHPAAVRGWLTELIEEVRP